MHIERVIIAVVYNAICYHTDLAETLIGYIFLIAFSRF